MAPAASTAREASAPGGALVTPAEVELWGDDGGGLGLDTPAPRPSWVRRTRVRIEESVWAPVALKLVGLVLGMLALSGVGMASMLGGAGGVQVPLAGMLGADIHAAWLANPSAAAHPAPSATNALLARTDAPAQAHAPEPEGGARSTAGATASAGAANVPAPATAPANSSAGMTDDGRVILNLAGVDDLRRLPGVGQKRAEAILALRTRLGRFKQVSDLLRVKGIGVRGLKKIMPKAVVDAPKPAA